MKQTDSIRIAAIANEVRMRAPMALATSYGATVSGSDGGYAVPVDAATAILMPETGALLPLCRKIPVTVGGSIRLPMDVDSALSASPAVLAAWQSEASQLPERKPNLRMGEFDLKKLTALVPVTDELLDDSDALAAWLPLALQTAVTRKVNDAIISGLGVGVPLGILNSSALVTITGGLAGVPLTDEYIDAMLERALSPLSSIWIANTGVYGNLTKLTGFDGATRTLCGLPIVLTDSCPALGALGDIILADMGFYLAAMKTPQLNSSMHIWFDQDLTAFKLMFRMDGMPALAAPVTPQNSSVTKSHFFALAARV